MNLRTHFNWGMILVVLGQILSAKLGPTTTNQDMATPSIMTIDSLSSRGNKRKEKDDRAQETQNGREDEEKALE